MYFAQIDLVILIFVPVRRNDQPLVGTDGKTRAKIALARGPAYVRVSGTQRASKKFQAKTRSESERK